MRRLALAALALVLPLAAAAQGPAAGLREMLALLPAGLADRPGLTVEYGDPAAARALPLAGVAGAAADPEVAQLRGLLPEVLQRALRDPATDWRATVGFGPAEVLRALSAGTGPEDRVNLVALAPGAGAAVGPALAAAGYSLQTVQDVTAWARGEDFAIDLRSRNPDDPFAGGMGRAARVEVQGDLIRHAAGWPALAALAGASGAPLADRPDVAALLAALDGVKGAGALVGAVLIGDAQALAEADPAEVLLGSAPARPAPPPAWRLALLADLGDGPASTAVLAVTLAGTDAAAAEALRAAVAEAWATRPAEGGPTFAELTGTGADVRILPGPGGLQVLVIAARGPTEVDGAGITQGRAYARLRAAAQQRALSFLRP